MINTSNLFTVKVVSALAVVCLLLWQFTTYNSGTLENMISYMEKNRDELERKVEGRDLITQMNYIPADMAAFRDYRLSGGQNMTFDEFKKDYQNTLEFSFAITDKPGGKGITKRIAESDQANREFMGTYYNYQAGKDIQMVVGKDTIPCQYLHAVQEGGIKDELLFTCGFERPPDDADDIQILFFDRIFGKDIYTYSFHVNDLLSTPSITE